MNAAARRPLLSVIVPLAAGETEAAGLLRQLHGLPDGSEVILAGTGAAGGARAMGAAPWPPEGWPGGIALRCLVGPPGRGRQLNRAAAAATGEWLWFLHADTRLSADALPALDAFLARGEAALGWFGLRFRDDGPRLVALNAWGANLRSAWFGMPFGDQGLVVPAAWFAAVGGHDETRRWGEDHMLVWALRRDGLPLRRIDATIETSARKYARHGWARTTWRHWLGTAAQAYAGARLPRRNGG